MTKKIDALQTRKSILFVKKQKSAAFGKKKKRVKSQQKPQFLIKSEDDEKDQIDTSIVKRENGEDNGVMEDTSLLADDEVSIKQEDDDDDDQYVDFSGDTQEEAESTDDETKVLCKTEDPPLKGDGKKKRKIGRRTRQRRGQRLYKAMMKDVDQEALISQAKTRLEKELMSKVFGGKSEIVSRLGKEEATSKTAVKAKVAKGAKAQRISSKTDKSERTAAWHDSDDEIEDDGANLKRNKYTRDQDELTYERRRKQFEQIVGQPKWADLNREAERSDTDEEALRKVGHVVKSTSAQGLPPGNIMLKRLKNLNRDTNNDGQIVSVSFHPASMVAVIASHLGKVSIVTVDGERNEKLHTIGLKKFRISCARLSHDGNELVVGSYRKFYHVYNLINGQSNTLKIPPTQTVCMREFRFSTCGKYLATIGECGEVHVLSGPAKELLWTIQLRYECQALAFTPDSRYLLCHSNDTEVTVYSIEKRRIVNVFSDEGCVNGSAISVCPNGLYVATGSRQGVVNIYSLDAVLENKQPVPLKSICNLITYIDTVTFNATSELLAMASSTIDSAIKLVHVKSGTVFKNFPIQPSSLGQVTCAEFSPGGGFLAVASKKNDVFLFRVKHYENY